jgi:predicted permease
MFSIIDTVLLRPLPFKDSDRLVIGRKSFDGGITASGPVSGYDWYDYREQSRSFEHLAMTMWGPFRSTVTGGEEPERVDVLFVSWDLFPMLQVTPVIGRLFEEKEAVVGGPPVVMLSYGYWERRFGGDAGIVGKTLTARGTPFTIIGVMPAGFRFLADTDLWSLTYRDGPGADARRWHNVIVAGKLKPGVTLEQAQQELDIISSSLAELYPDSNKGKSLLLTSLRDFMVENARTSLWLLMATVVLVLLIACGNVAGLLLARGQSRLSEITVRSAMGASRQQLIRQLLVESVLLAVAAGAVGILFATFFMRLMLRLLPGGQFGNLQPALDTRVLFFTLLVSLATGLVFGTIPAFRSTALELSRHLRSGTRASEDRGGSRLRATMVAFQVAMSVFLLISSGLLIRSLARQVGSDLGFRPENLLMAEIQIEANDYPEPARRLAFFRTLLEEVRSLPFVESATLVNQLPIRDPGNDIYAWPAGQPPASAQETRSAFDRIVFPGYFRVMGIPFTVGRDLAETDTAGSPRVVVISSSMARDLFPGLNPVGQRMVIDMREKIEHEVVGVVEDVRMTSVRSDPYRTMYTSYLQRPGFRMRLAVRASGKPESLVPSIRQILRRLDRKVPLAEPATMLEVIDRSISSFRIVTISLGLFSAIALLLTSIGLYGVLAFWINLHMFEFGIRMALGATGTDTVGLIARRGFLLVAIGLLPGIGAAVFGTRIIRQLLFEVEPLDPASYLGAAIFLIAITAVACVLPAMRALRIDPMRALRAE